MKRNGCVDENGESEGDEGEELEELEEEDGGEAERLLPPFDFRLFRFILDDLMDFFDDFSFFLDRLRRRDLLRIESLLAALSESDDESVEETLVERFPLLENEAVEI